jgi:hypothetical protein
MLASKFKIRHNGEFCTNTQIIVSAAYSSFYTHYLLQFQMFYLAYILSLPEGRAGTSLQKFKAVNFVFLPFNICLRSDKNMLLSPTPFSALHICYFSNINKAIHHIIYLFLRKT